jgi:uncharacterized coiled-coil DUF342 family protein
MLLPNEPVTLSVEQIAELNRNLADMRHDVNNRLSLMIAAIELLHRRPENYNQLVDSLAEQLPQITQIITRFSHELETALHVSRP